MTSLAPRRPLPKRRADPCLYHTRNRRACRDRIELARGRHDTPRSGGVGGRDAACVRVGLAEFLRKHRSRAVRPGHDPRHPLSDPWTARPRRDGRGLSRRRSAPRTTGRVEVPSGGALRRSRTAGAIPQRGAHGKAGVASERLPRVRHRRDRRAAVHHDGVRRRRGSRRAAPPDRPPSRRQRHRDRPADLCRSCRRARTRCAPSRSEAGEHHARWRGKSPSDGFQPRGRRSGHRHSRRHAGIHGAGAARRTGGHRPQRHLRARPRVVRDLHGTPRVRGQDTRGPSRAAPVGNADRAHDDRQIAGPRDRGSHRPVPRSGACAPARVRDRGVGGASRRRSARRGARRRRDAVARDGRRGWRRRRNPQCRRGRHVARRRSRERVRGCRDRRKILPVEPRAAVEAGGRADGSRRADPPIGRVQGAAARHRVRLLLRDRLLRMGAIAGTLECVDVRPGVGPAGSRALLVPDGAGRAHPVKCKHLGYANRSAVPRPRHDEAHGRHRRTAAPLRGGAAAGRDVGRESGGADGLESRVRRSGSRHGGVHGNHAVPDAVDLCGRTPRVERHAARNVHSHHD